MAKAAADEPHRIGRNLRNDFPCTPHQVSRTLACLHAVGTVIAQRVRLKRKQFDSTRISLLSSQAIETLINDDMINDDMISGDIEAPPSIYI